MGATLDSGQPAAMAAPPPSRFALACFSAPCLALAALGLPLVVYLPKYYADDLGLDLAAVGAAFMIVRLLDIGVDPVLGALMDRTHTRWGRFKPWLVAGGPVLMLATAMLFFARPGVGVTWLSAGLLLAYGGWSICVLAQTSWGALLSADYSQRSRVYAWWQTANVFGLILVLVTPVAIAQMNPEPGAGMRAMGIAVLILLPLTIGIAALGVREPPVKAAAHLASVREWLDLFKSTAVRRLMISDVVLGLVPGIAASLFLFYFEQGKGFAEGPTNILLLVYFVAALFGAPLWSAIAKPLGKHRALAYAALFYLVGQAALWLIPPGAFALAVVAAFLAGLPYSASSVLLRAMMADVADEERLRTGVDRTGLLYALLTGATKVGAAFAVGLTFVGLKLAGFDPQGGNSEAALMGLEVLFLVLPAVLSVLAALILFGYPLDAARYAEVRAALALKDAETVT
jgi:glycoside/pentoside/hexuronide:cation symporter, GPH family